MLNVEKGVTHVDNRWKKLEKPSVQQIQDARFMPDSLLNRIRRAKSASGYQNVELKRLAFLRLHLTDVMFSNASQRHETRVSTTEREANEVCISQMLPGKYDNQECKVHVSS